MQHLLHFATYERGLSGIDTRIFDARIDYRREQGYN